MTLRIAVVTLFCFKVSFSYSQDEPVRWFFRAHHLHTNEYMLNFEATLQPGWHIYSQCQEGSAVPTRFRIDPTEAVVFRGKTHETGAVHQYDDPVFGGAVTSFTGKVLFSQKIMLTYPIPYVSGSVAYMTCNFSVCMLRERNFVIPIPGT